MPKFVGWNLRKLGAGWWCSCIKLSCFFFVQVNMPVDSFESPLTLAACGGHYELAALLISRGADLEEVNDEG